MWKLYQNYILEKIVYYTFYNTSKLESDTDQQVNSKKWNRLSSEKVNKIMFVREFHSEFIYNADTNMFELKNSHVTLTSLPR